MASASESGIQNLPLKSGLWPFLCLSGSQQLLPASPVESNTDLTSGSPSFLSSPFPRPNRREGPM